MGPEQLPASWRAVVGDEFRQPYFLNPHQTLVVPLTQEREDEPGFTNQRIRLAPRVERKFLPELRAALGYNIEYDDTSNVPDETKAAIEGFKARGIVSSVTGFVERNTTPDLLDPHTGSVVNLTGEQAGGRLAKTGRAAGDEGRGVAQVEHGSSSGVGPMLSAVHR